MIRDDLMKKLLLLVITATVLAYVVTSIGFWLFENMFSVAGRVFHCNAHKLYVEGKGPAPNQYRVLSYLFVEHLFKCVPCVDTAAHTSSFEGELASKISLPLLLTTSSILDRFFPRREKRWRQIWSFF